MREALIGEIARRVHALGGRALLVGGCVRDGLLMRQSSDIDCEVHGVAPEALRDMLAQLGGIDESGAAYGIYTLRGAGIDIALPRLEKRTGPGHRDFFVTIDPMLPPERAAARRDFTVNAIMRDALTGEYVDPFGGIDDLRRGVLRMVPGGQFEEDALRVLRGAQFAARFHLSPDAQTLSAMRRMPVSGLSAPRVLDETRKALLKAEKPGVYFEVLERAGALKPWFMELAALRGVKQNPVYHPEGDALTHTLMVLDEAAAVREQVKEALPFMLAALTHDLGKALSTVKNEKGVFQSTGHERTGVPLVQAMLSRLGVPRSSIAYAQGMCRLHMRAHACFYQKARVSRTHLLFDESACPRELMLLAVCDARGKGGPRERADEEERFLRARLEAYERAAAQPMPTGGMLIDAGVEPGAALGRALGRARRLVLCGMPLEQAVREAANEA